MTRDYGLWSLIDLKNELRKRNAKLTGKKAVLVKSCSLIWYFPIEHCNMAQLQYFVLTGEPGVGKTTLIKKLSCLLNENGIKTSGFYTEELRKNGFREGFDVVTLDGQRGILARTTTSSFNGHYKYKVGKYGVDVKEFESVALPSLRSEELQHIIVIDEIGKMELFSEKFKHKVTEILSSRFNSVVLLTIPIKKGSSLIESIRCNSRSKVWTVTKENRNEIGEDILQSIKTTINL